MPLVAIAGGTSRGLGYSITKAILELYPNGEWQPIILSRCVLPPDWLPKLPSAAVEIRKVNYESFDSLVAGLRGVHTVLSVLLANDNTQASSEINLLHAAVQAGCKRFAPSEWAFGPAAVEHISLLNAQKPLVWEACEKAESESNIEWARFNVGLFMNYFGIGCSKLLAATSTPENELVVRQQALEKEAAACAGVDRQGDMGDGSGSFLLSLRGAEAELPIKADGTFPRVTLTEIGNMGMFVAASLRLERWERDMNIVGCNIRLDELLSHVEAATGRRFEVKTLQLEDLEKEVHKLLPEAFLKKIWLELKLMIARDAVGEGVLDPVVNKLCPEIKPLDFESYLQKYWM